MNYPRFNILFDFQEATSVVAQGQIIPVLPGGPLYQSIGAGEMAIRDVLFRLDILPISSVFQYAGL